MTLRRQLLLLLLVHIIVALAAWDGYRIGFKKGYGDALYDQQRARAVQDQTPPRVPTEADKKCPEAHNCDASGKVVSKCGIWIEKDKDYMTWNGHCNADPEGATTYFNEHTGKVWHQKSVYDLPEESDPSPKSWIRRAPSTPGRERWDANWRLN